MSKENKRENMDNHQTENPCEKPISTPKNESDELRQSEMTCIDKVNQLNISEPERNTGIVIKKIESESLNSLLAYDSDSSSSSEMMKLNLNWQVRDDSSTSSSSSSEEDSDTDSDESVPEAEPSPSRGAIRKDKPMVPKADGELSLDELPPVPDLSNLSINVEHENFVHMGNVLGIVDKLVTVAALPNTPAYDLDTLLFLENGKKPLGFVFDVLGQVTSPIYAIRFNSVEDIKNLQVQVGTKVYSAPTSKHTQYVFLQQLLKMKGTDASWVGDTECPAEFADFSDDENECYQRYGSHKVSPHVKRTHSSDNYKKFETTMNKRNILNTKFNKYMDSYKQARLNKAKLRRPQATAAHINASLASFDPSVPPPNLRPMFYEGVMAPDYLGAYFDGSSGENNNAFNQHYFTNNFAANLSNQTNSANYFTNHAGGNNHPGPSHE